MVFSASHEQATHLNRWGAPIFRRIITLFLQAGNHKTVQYTPLVPRLVADSNLCQVAQYGFALVGRRSTGCGKTLVAV